VPEATAFFRSRRFFCGSGCFGVVKSLTLKEKMLILLKFLRFTGSSYLNFVCRGRLKGGMVKPDACKDAKVSTATDG
jgi:hypothetical protein